jgi:hypothetical protein
MVARVAICDVLAAFCERLDRYDIEDACRLFAEDCWTDYGPMSGGRIHGRVALSERIRVSQGRFKRTHHQLGQALIEVSGDSAKSLAYVTAWHLDWAGQIMILMLQYHDVLRRTDGQWLITERRALATGVEGMDGEGLNWLVREPRQV